MHADQAKAFYLKTAEESLKRLQTDYIDILLSHGVREIDWLNNPGIIEALQLLKKQGKVRFIGFSTHSNMTECINDAVRSDLYEVILTTFNFALSDDKNLLAALKNASEKKIGLIAMKTQYPRKEGHWKELFQTLARYYHTLHYDDRTIHTAILKWTLRHPFITTAIPGFTTFQHIDDDFLVAYDLEYTDQEKKLLIDMNLSLTYGCCRQCYDCVRSCPKGVDIPTLMRVHMYATSYYNFPHARQTFDDIPLNKSLGNCASCDQCPVQCKHGVNIADRLNELQVIYS
jgi:predicted aldo/keto reductase-like oxidoreductase